METLAALEELLSIHRVKDMTGLGRTNIYLRMKDKKFPPSIRVGGRALWIRSEVQQWIRERIEENRN